MTSRRVEPSGASRASSQASTASTMAPSVCASVKRKSVQIEAPIDDVDIDLAAIGDFDVSASSEEAEAIERPESQMEAPPPVIPSTKRRKTSVVWECYPEDKFVTIGDATFAVCKYCQKKLKLQKTKATSHLTRHMGQCVERKKAMGKDLVVGGQTVLGFERSTSGVPTPTVVKTKTTYEHPKVREALAHMVMISELPFNFVEHPDFINFCHVLQPFYEKVGRKQVKADCFRVYQTERDRLKKVFEETRRISITTDLWKSDHQSIEYMVLTAHWVDQSWSLNKQIINFVHLPPPRRGIDIAAAIFDCLKGWGIEHKVETVTVDNASANDSCVKRLKEDFQMQRTLLCDGKLFHVRCTAHIVNLLVQDGVAVIKPIIDNIRESVKFVKASEARQKNFAKIAMQCGIKERKLVLDCATRWNSTYKMLVTALQFREVFLRFMFAESSYIYCPTREEWERLEVVCDFLEIFDDITKIISGSQYTTANRYFQEVFRIKEVLREREFDEDYSISMMVRAMSEKFDKYWGEVNFLMTIASIMDPRIKFFMITLAYPTLYGEENAPVEIENVKRALEKLYGEYVDMLSSRNSSTAFAHPEHQPKTQQAPSSTSGKSSSSRYSETRHYGPGYSWMRLKDHKEKTYSVESKKSELEMYLDEHCVEIPDDVNSTDFNVLHWWRDNQYKYKSPFTNGSRYLSNSYYNSGFRERI